MDGSLFEIRRDLQSQVQEIELMFGGVVAGLLSCSRERSGETEEKKEGETKEHKWSGLREVAVWLRQIGGDLCRCHEASRAERRRRCQPALLSSVLRMNPRFGRAESGERREGRLALNA